MRPQLSLENQILKTAFSTLNSSPNFGRRPERIRFTDFAIFHFSDSQLSQAKRQTSRAHAYIKRISFFGTFFWSMDGMTTVRVIANNKLPKETFSKSRCVHNWADKIRFLHAHLDLKFGVQTLVVDPNASDLPISRFSIFPKFKVPRPKVQAWASDRSSFKIFKFPKLVPRAHAYIKRISFFGSFFVWMDATVMTNS